MQLPPAKTMRWTVSKKLAVLSAVDRGMLTLAEARARYLLSEEEFAAWQDAFERHGAYGLRFKCLQKARRPAAKSDGSGSGSPGAEQR
jgi:hypothetical protein